MSKQRIKTINVSSGVSASFLEQVLTQDISPLEALFDLIDNSIDAARDHLFQSKHSLDEYGLPTDYSGYSIHIRIDKNSIRVLDNCLGINEHSLSQKTFRIAEPSDHAFGIGHYGLGLKRSLLKLGSSYAMSTDTGDSAFVMKFNNLNFGGISSQPLTADQFTTIGRKKALFSVSNLKLNIRHEMQEEIWYKNAVLQLSIRYAPYLSKNLKLSIRSIPHHKSNKIVGMIPTLRTDAKVPIRKKYYEADGVKVFIDAGIHSAHTFTEEKKKGKSEESNRAISAEYGIYYICNDRVIVAASASSEHGFRTNRWHSEYNGFVCLVRFVSEDSKKMPWNTAKTALKTDSTIFLKVRHLVEPIADIYRGEIKKMYPAPAKKKAGKNSGETTQKDSSSASSDNNSTSTSATKAENNQTNTAIIKALNIEELIHPAIRRHAYQHYLNGHYRDAVFNSIVALFDLIRERTSLKVDGAKLIGQVFAPEHPLLILSEIDTESGLNDQKGFMQIFSGAYQGIRNPKAHSLEHDLDQAKAAQYLVFASLLLRRVDEAKKP